VAASGGDPAPAAFRLYGSPTSGNAFKPALMLSLCGQPFEFRSIDLQGGAARTEAFRSVNRFQEVPVLEHDGRRIVQSGVILLYLAEQLGRFGHRNEDERWTIQEWLAWDNQRMTGGPALLRYLRRWVPETDPAVLAFLRTRAERALGQLAAGLAETGWLVGGRPTIADLAACAYAFWLDEAGLEAQRWPAIPAWLERIAALPGFAPAAVLMKG
jgi:glutathione S-transferase